MNKFSYIKYTFDPENKMLVWNIFEESDECKVPKFGKVTHATGRKYFVAYPGNKNNPRIEATAKRALLKFYIEKLKSSANDLNKAAHSVDILASFLREKKLPFNEEED